jgi:hypothetical protein
LPAEGVWYRGKVRALLRRDIAAVVCVAAAQLTLAVFSKGADGPVFDEHDRVKE